MAGAAAEPAARSAAEAAAEAVAWSPLAGWVLALVAAAVLLLLGWAWVARQRWALAREHALAERFRSERDEALTAQAQASDALALAERQLAAQARWLASASHDLRQPAHALGLYLGALQALPAVRADAEAAEIGERMRGSLVALEALLAAALDVSRIDAGAVVPQWQVVALAPLLRRLADEWALPAESRGLRLSLHVADAEALTITDPQLLERVLRNLLANAVKYTHTGGVLLACRRRHADSGVQRWRIEVWDSGVGIAEADHERVFEAYEQLGGPRRQGHGLGLAIVWRLASLLQLRVQLRSRPGRGSVFFVDGLVPAGHAPREVAAQQQRGRRLQGLRVAVLDDDAAVRDATLRLLARWGVEAWDARDPSPPACRPDALLADLQLSKLNAAGLNAADRNAAGSGADGPATVARLRQQWAAGSGRPPCPVLWISAEPEGSPLRAQLPPGAQLLAKPLSPPRLRAWLESLTEDPPAMPDTRAP